MPPTIRATFWTSIDPRALAVAEFKGEGWCGNGGHDSKDFEPWGSHPPILQAFLAP
jgi:hypothetical protein